MSSSRCIIIPAIKKNAVIPDQLVKKLAGKTLIQRALDTAKRLAPGTDIHVVTDSDEIRLICERNEVESVYDPAFTIASLDIVFSLKPILEKLAARYEHLVIYRPSSPLMNSEDIEHAYEAFCRSKKDCLVSVKSVKYRFWRNNSGDLDSLLFNENEAEAYIETKALFMLHSSALLDTSAENKADLKVMPYFINDRSVEINSYQDWWICEKLLQTKHVVFVVAGYPAIGMGHIYRALMLANEIADHRVSFLCTKESELAARNIAARDYHTKIQTTDNLAADVLRLKPDLVINDILDTDEAYMAALKEEGVALVNFEDEGEGTAHADLVINALYESHMQPSPRYLYGYHNFCLRDEFVHAQPNTFCEQAKQVLITFGGTDSDDFTRSTLETILPLCAAAGIAILIVTGPGYEHKDALSQRIEEINAESSIRITFMHATNVMSHCMEQADFAICSAGRTVYELTHMRLPAIVMAHHPREDMHSFARPRNGFIYLGIMNPFNAESLAAAFTTMLDAEHRKEFFMRMKRFDFTHNKHHVVKRMLALISGVGTGKP